MTGVSVLRSRVTSSAITFTFIATTASAKRSMPVAAGSMRSTSCRMLPSRVVVQAVVYAAFEPVFIAAERSPSMRELASSIVPSMSSPNCRTMPAARRSSSSSIGGHS